MAKEAEASFNEMLAQHPRLIIQNEDGTRAIVFDDASKVIKSVRISIANGKEEPIQQPASDGV
ncbi:MAG: hypothetical protein IJK99_09315 [Bacteroidales bacterium]|nr:hypothetical protein [Bacteroidales bacterium]